MSNALERQLREIEDELQQSAERGLPCPECHYGQQLLIIKEGEPEPICGTCGLPKARGEGIRIIEIRTRQDGPR